MYKSDGEKERSNSRKKYRILHKITDPRKTTNPPQKNTSGGAFFGCPAGKSTFTGATLENTPPSEVATPVFTGALLLSPR